MRPARDLEALLPDWIKRVRDDYRRRGMKENTTITRTVQDMYYSWANHGVDLSKIQETELLKHLDEYQRTHKQNAYRIHVVLTKKALKILGRKKLADNLRIPAREDTTKSIQILSREDREKLIRGALSLQERLIIELLDATGGRRGELWKLRIKDVQWDEYSAIVWLDGKTGTRRRRVYDSVAKDLREQINNHPRKDDPDATILYFQDGYRAKNKGAPMNSTKFYRIVHSMGKRILGRPIHPHLFRHTRATEDCRYFTDRELMKLYGWKRPEQATVYTHLSMKDVDDKDLVLHGLKSKEEILRPIMQTQRCPNCGEENAPIAIYCAKCGKVLGPQSQKEAVQEEVRRILREEYPQLVKELGRHAE